MSTDHTVPIPLKWGSTTLQTGSGTIEYTADLTGLDFSDSFTISDFYTEVDQAFARWEDVADVDFVKVTSGSADVSFGVGLLADPAAAGLASISYIPFDDVGKITSGSVTMDLDRVWAPEGGAEGLDFFAVALHEIGHILGLRHIDDPTEIMNPVITVDDLGDNDIAAIQALYGEAGDGGGDSEPVDEDSDDEENPPAEDDGGGGGGGIAALILGLLAAIVAVFSGGGGAAAATTLVAAGRIDGEDDASETLDDGIPDVDIPDLDPEEFLPQIVVDDHYVYIGDDGHAHDHGCGCGMCCQRDDDWDETAFV